MSGVVVRRATLQDHQGVMDIGIMYDGMDYLPYFYKEIVNDPDYLCYVCVVDGEIVGFDCVLIHDGGSVAQPRAGRVKESHRGNGYLQLMGQQIREDITDVTSAERMMFVRARSGINWANLNPAVKHIDNSNLYEFSISKSRYYKTRQVSSATRMYERDVLALFEASSVCHKLFPCDLICQYHLPLGLHKANIRHIINDNSTIFATYTQKSNNSNTVSCKRPKDISLLTIGWHYKVPAGQRCSISIHGDDLATFDSHVQAHIEQSPSPNDHLNMGFYTSESFPIDVLTKMFTIYGTSGFHLYPMCTFKWELEEKNNKSKY